VNKDVHLFRPQCSSSHSKLTVVISAVASLDEAEGPQHLEVGTEWMGVRKCLLFRRGVTPDFFYILNTKSCILVHSLALKIGTASVFIETPKH